MSCEVYWTLTLRMKKAGGGRVYYIWVRVRGYISYIILQILEMTFAYLRYSIVMDYL